MADLQVAILLSAVNNASGAIGAVEAELSRLNSTVGTSTTGLGAHTGAVTANDGALGQLNSKAAASFEQISRLSDANFAAAGHTTEHAAATTAAEHALGQFGTTAATSEGALARHATTTAAGATALNQHATATTSSASALGQHAAATDNSEHAMGRMNVTAAASTGVFGQFRDLAVQGFGLSVGWQAFQDVTSAIENVIPAAAHFETTLNQVRQNTGLTADQMDVLKQGVIDLSRESGVSTDLISAGWMHVMNVTQNSADATGILEVAMKSAVSTGGNVSDTADVLARAMHEYGLDTSKAADETARHNEVLTNANSVMAAFHTAAQLSDVTLQQFSANSSIAIGLSSQLGIPINEAAAALSTLAKHGFDAATAQTQYDASLTHIINPTKAAEAELARLSKTTGVDLVGAFSSAGLHQNGYIGTLNLLHEALVGSGADEYAQAAALVQVGLGTKDTNEAIKTLGLSQADVTGETLKLIAAQRGGIGTAAELTVGWDDLLTNNEKIRQSMKDGTVTQEAWNDTAKTTDQQWKVLTNSFQLGAIELGGHLLPAMNDIIGALSSKMGPAADLVRGVFTAFTSNAGAMGLVLDQVRKLFGDAVADGFQPFAQEIMDRIPAIRGAFQDFATEATPAVKDVVKQVGDLAPQVVITMGDVANGVGMGVEALNHLQTASATSSVGIHNSIIGVAKDFDQQTSGINAAVDEQVTKVTRGWSLQAAAADSGGRLSVVSTMKAFDNQTAGINSAVDQQVNRVQTGWALQVAAVPVAMGQISTAVQTGFAAIGPAFDALGTSVRGGLDALGSAVGGFFNGLGTTVRGALDAIGSTVGGWASSLGAAVRGALDVIGSAVGGFFDGFGSTIQAGLSAISGFFSDTWNAIPEDIRSDLGIVIGLIGDHFSTLGSMVQAGMSAVGSAIGDGWNAITSVVGGAMSTVGSAVQAGWDAITSAVGGAMSAIGSAVQAGWDAISGAVGGAMSAIGFAVSAGWDAVTGAVTGAMTSTESASSSGWDTITVAVGGAMSTIGSSVRTGFDAVTTAVSSALATALSAVQGWIGQVVGAIQGMAGQLAAAGAAAGQAAVDGLVGAIRRGIDAVGDAAAALARSALASAKAALGAQSPSLEFAILGQAAGDGMIVGLNSKNPAVKAAAQELVRQSLIAVREAAPVDSFIIAGQDMGDGLDLGLLRGVDKAKSAADTYGNSILTEMQSFTKNVDTEIENTTNKLADIATAAGTAIQSALDKENDSITSAVGKAQTSLNALYATANLNTDISARKNALADEITQETLAHTITAAADELQYQHQLALSKATTQAERDRINATYADQVVAAKHSQDLAAADTAFKAGEALKTKNLDAQLAGEALARQISTIISGRTVAISSAQEVYVDAVQKAQLTADTQRLILLRSYTQRIHGQHQRPDIGDGRGGSR